MRIHFVSLGCDKNLVDSEIMLGIIDQEGYTITSDETEADAIIVNTCSFITDATDEGVQTILKMAEQKVEGVCKSLIVTGCMAQRYKDEIFKELPEVDAVVGVGDFEAIAKVIKETAAGGRVNLVTEGKVNFDDKNNLNRLITTPGYFSYLKISEGCDNNCTYCTIPSIRGKYRSRQMDSLMAEAEMLAQKGVKELILVAQDTALYGKDLYGKAMLHELLHKISEVQGIEWIRILYCYPEHITEELIQEMTVNPKVCHYLDMPIQHSDNGVLRRMGRKSTTEKLKDVISRLRQAMPDISIRTTLIVGFPGETEEEFRNLSQFVKDIQFDRLGVFKYSKEEGTPAYHLPDQIQEEIKERREDKIMRLQKTISKKNNKRHVGQVLQVIVDGKIPEDDIYCGRSFADCYEIDGMIYFKSEYEILTGEFLNILITEASDYDLIGEIAYEPSE